MNPHCKTAAFVALMTGLCATPACAAPGATEVRLVVDCEKHTMRIADPGGVVLCLSRHVIADRSGIVDVRKVDVDGAPEIQITLDAEAATRLAAATSHAIPLTEQLAIIHNGKLLSKIAIAEPITGNTLVIRDSYHPESLDRLLAELSQESPP